MPPGGLAYSLGAMPNCEQDQVEILPGRNTWLLARTDRDGANVEDVLQTAGAALMRFLGDASPAGTRSIFEVLQSPQSPPGGARFIIGAARPVLVHAFQAADEREALAQLGTLPIGPNARQLARFEQCPTIRTIKVEDRPWFVRVDFDWRAGRRDIDWPRRAVNLLGFPTNDDHNLDWLLLGALHQSVQPAEPDTTLREEFSEETKEALRRAKNVGKPLLLALAVGVGLGAVIYFQKGRKAKGAT